MRKIRNYIERLNKRNLVLPLKQYKLNLDQEIFSFVFHEISEAQIQRNCILHALDLDKWENPKSGDMKSIIFFCGQGKER